MIKTLYSISVLCFLGAGLLFGLSGEQWLRGTPPEGDNPEPSLHDRLSALKLGDSGPATVPLLEQAAVFAQYLNPPQPPVLAKPTPAVGAPPAPPDPRPANPTPTFRLLAISYYRFCPELSLAMIWDPVKGGYWIREGESVGHFVVEKIEKDAIFYRDGNQLRQMAITVSQPGPQAAPESGLRKEAGPSLETAKVLK